MIETRIAIGTEVLTLVGLYFALGIGRHKP